MRNRKSVLDVLVFCILLFVIAVCKNTVEASQLKVEDAKDAIVEVQTGLGNSDGKFYEMKSASGFVVCNETGSVYIVTANHSVTVNKSEKKKFCKKHKLNKTASGLDTEIHILVEGDVASDVTVKASSKKDDFCILEAGNVLNKKISLCLLDDAEMSIGDSVYMLGYPARSKDKKVYSSKDVEIHGGEVQDNAAMVDGNSYIQHSAVTLEEQSGGALVNEKGYLVGMGNSAVTNNSIDAYYALPINKIQVILDNYGIAYASTKKKEAIENLRKTYKECLQLIESNEYKKDSLESLETAVQNVKEIIDKKQLASDEIDSAQKGLDQGREKLKRKTPKIKIVKYILLPVIIFLAILTIQSGVAYRKIRRQVRRQQNSDELRQEETPDGFQKMFEELESPERKGQDLIVPEPIVGKTVLMGHNTSTPQLSGTGSGVNVFDTQGAYLVDAGTGSRYYITKKTFFIGKNPDNDFQIIKTTISRKHAVILWREGNYYIKDQGSVNGTYVNGKAVGGGVKLCNHDIVTLAKEKMEFVLKEV